MPSSLKGMYCVLAAFAVLSLICGEGWRASRQEAGHASERNRELSSRLTTLGGEVAASRKEAGEFRASAEQKISELERQIAGFTRINQVPRAELGEQPGPFAVPNGEIRWIDPIGRKVWINLGEADSLKPRSTFSVYKKNRTRINDWKVEIAVGPADIKGAIEITRIVNAHLAEARILNEKLESPVAKGDPIYSPNWYSEWRPAQGESISIIGLLDLDGDGTEDRDRFLEIVAAARVHIDNEVDENGSLRINGKVRNDGKPQISRFTKFVVIATIPEMDEGADPGKVKPILKLLERRRELEEAARQRGVRVISLEDFLRYIGFKPKQGGFPVRKVLNNTRTGAGNFAAGDPGGPSRRSGSSSLYSGDKALKPKTFSGPDTSRSPFRK